MSMNLTIDDLKEIVRSLEKLDESGLEVTQIKVRNHHIHLRSVVPNTADVIMTLPENYKPAPIMQQFAETVPGPVAGETRELPVRPTERGYYGPSHTVSGQRVRDAITGKPVVAMPSDSPEAHREPKRTWYVSGIAIASEPPSKPGYRQ